MPNAIVGVAGITANDTNAAPVTVSAKGSWSTVTRAVAATATVSTATATVTQTVVSAPPLLPQDVVPVSDQPAG